ncbi:MAG: DegT/DnrJ/EryC1/StrS family aminotransferase [Bacteroidales bacterium]|nr:DegT/DnrJ/EryC1/StrS family aminotransferase [Bacteroidales bacterium]
MKKIPVTRPSLPPFDEYCAELRKIWDSRILTNMGEEHEAFRSALAEYLEMPGTVPFANGHLSLEAALAALRLPAGAEVITTPFSFVSTTHAIVRSGLNPVFCDVLEDGTLDPSGLEALVTERTAAILPVHVYGRVCDVDRIAAVAARHSLKVLYDAAHAFGVRYRGVPVVRYGDASVLSFHATKVFSTVEGGAVCTADPSLLQRLEDAKNFGIRDEEHCAAVGGNAKMNEFQAAMGLCNLRHIGTAIAGRHARAEQYRARLEGRPGLRIPARQEGVLPNDAYFPVFFRTQELRDRVYARLAGADIYARKYFYPLIPDLDCYAGSGAALAARVPVARQLAAGVLCLPLYADLLPEETDRICDCVIGALERG